MITSIAAPSLIPEALAAVTVPSFLNAGFIPEIDSAVTPSLIYSSVSTTVVAFFVTISTGTISSLHLPSALAFDALC